MENISLDCGWGKILFSKTFSSIDKLASDLKKERKNGRNIAFGVDNPQILFSRYPQDFFLNPAYTYQINLEKFSTRRGKKKEFFITKARTAEEIEELNKIYTSLKMVPLKKNWIREKPDAITIYLAKEENTEKILAGCMVIDHFLAFGEKEKHCSLWALAVDSQSQYPGIGGTIMKKAMQEWKRKKRKKFFLSVVAENFPAIKFYESLGFTKTSLLSVKNKTPINEYLFTSENFIEKFSPHVRGIVLEAQKRGIQVIQIIDDFYQLSFGGRVLRCQESLTELTNSLVVKSCRDHRLFTHLLAQEKISLPDSIETKSIQRAKKFLEQKNAEKKTVVVKTPIKNFSSENIGRINSLKKNFSNILSYNNSVVVQEFNPGSVYRFLVIDFSVVGIVRTDAPSITGNGVLSIRKLIQKISRRKFSQSNGESKIPLDSNTKNFIASQGYSLDDILPKGIAIAVRKTATYDTGGTMVDVQEYIPKYFSGIARKIAKILKISVVDIEIVIPDIEKEEYSLLSANSKPHFTYYPGKKVYEKFIDFLFPQTKK